MVGRTSLQFLHRYAPNTVRFTPFALSLSKGSLRLRQAQRERDGFMRTVLDTLPPLTMVDLVVLSHALRVERKRGQSKISYLSCTLRSLIFLNFDLTPVACGRTTAKTRSASSVAALIRVRSLRLILNQLQAACCAVGLSPPIETLARSAQRRGQEI